MMLSGENIDKGAIAKAVPLRCMASVGNVIICSLGRPLMEDVITSLKESGLSISQVTF